MFNAPIQYIKTTTKEAIIGTAQKTVTSYIKGTVDSMFSSAVSMIGTSMRFTIERDISRCESILRQWDPVSFQRNSVESTYREEARTVLRKNIHYFIILPEYNFISVSKSDYFLELFVGGPQYDYIVSKINERVENGEDYGGYSDDEEDDDNERKLIARIRSLTFDSVSENVKTGNSSYVNAKSLDQIYTSQENKDQLFNYVLKWQKAQEFFSSLSVAHKLGILLYGPPGTGKTSLAKTLAATLEATLYTVNMSTFPREVPDLRSVLPEDKLSIVLFEDIDYYFASENNREQQQALLQTLDGANSADNVIFIATTNSIESLSEALIRDGRFDLKIEMGNIESEATAKEMCESFYLSSEQAEQLLSTMSYPINPAALQNKCIQFIFDNLDDWLETNQEDIEMEVSENNSSIKEYKRKHGSFWDILQN